MQHESTVPIIGGSAHGKSINAGKDMDEIEIDVQTTDSPTQDSTFTEEYERRRFEGEEFGEGFECFVFKSDDATEQKELARWTINQLADLPEQF